MICLSPILNFPILQYHNSKKPNRRVNRTARVSFFLKVEKTLNDVLPMNFFWKPLLPVTQTFRSTERFAGTHERYCEGLSNNFIIITNQNGGKKCFNSIGKRESFLFKFVLLCPCLLFAHALQPHRKALNWHSNLW
jgi:hypothetical protein